MTDVNFGTPKTQYDLSDLSLFENGPLREFDALTNMLHQLIAKDVALAFADEVTQKVHIRSAAGRPLRSTTIPFQGSATSDVVARNRPISTRTQGSGRRYEELEASQSKSFYAAPITDPNSVAVGALIVMSEDWHVWTKNEADAVQDTAFLVSRLLLLRASMQTLRIMATEIRFRAN